MPLTIGLAMLVSAALGTSTAQAASDTVPLSTAPTQTVEQYVRTYFADTPVMISISRCESKFRQFGKDGSVLRGNNPADVGIMQINQYYHDDEAKALGYDLMTIEGNVRYARFLYNREGTAPWISSSKCWNPSSNTASTNNAITKVSTSTPLAVRS